MNAGGVISDSTEVQIPKGEACLTIPSSRLAQKKETWVRNVKRIYGWDEIRAQEAFDRIRPFE